MGKIVSLVSLRVCLVGKCDVLNSYWMGVLEEWYQACCLFRAMDRDAFGQCYLEGRPRTIRFLRSAGFHDDAAVELAQFAWSRAWERIDQLRDDSSLLSWVNTIAINEGRRAVRRSKNHLCVSDLPGSAIDTAAIDVDRILKRCSEEHRSLLTSQLAGASISELAAERKITEAALRLRSYRARKAARDLCQSLPQAEIREVDAIALKLEKLRNQFHANRLLLAARLIELTTTYLALVPITPSVEIRQRLYAHIERALARASNILTTMCPLDAKAKLMHRTVGGLRDRLAEVKFQQDPKWSFQSTDDCPDAA